MSKFKEGDRVRVVSLEHGEEGEYEFYNVGDTGIYHINGWVRFDESPTVCRLSDGDTTWSVGDVHLVKITEERMKIKMVTKEWYYEMLGAVPPIQYGSGWFQVGEAMASDPETGEPTYDLYVKICRRYYHFGDVTVEKALEMHPDFTKLVEEYIE